MTEPSASGSGGAEGGDVFGSVEDVITRFAAEGYLADQRLATTVFVQSRLSRPLLLEGPAGVGKTALATTLARVTGRPLLRLQCYEGQDETTALYEWDYGKQLLYTQLLREKIGQIVGDATTLNEAVDKIAAEDSVFFSERFLAERPLLAAVRSAEPVVLLIDEVDRADEALEAVLLEVLAEYQVSVPEIGTFRARRIPLVILTSNNTRDLSAALKRRCLHLSLGYPDKDRELAIIEAADTGLNSAAAAVLVEVIRQLRELDLRKAPSISETIDWARTLAVLGAKELTAEVLAGTANVAIKYERDLRRTLEVLPSMVDPNAEVPSPGHSHGPDHDHDHGPGHSHGGGPAHAHPESGDLPPDPAGQAVRAAKDSEGRHDENYYGAPGRITRPGPGTVGRSQGERSFNSRSARRRPV